jgi:hypothetical protein
MIIWPWQITPILRKLMSDVARLDQAIIDLVATFDAELEQIQAELAKPKPDLSAQIAKIVELRDRVAAVIPDPEPDPVPTETEGVSVDEPEPPAEPPTEELPE